MQIFYTQNPVLKKKLKILLPCIWVFAIEHKFVPINDFFKIDITNIDNIRIMFISLLVTIQFMYNMLEFDMEWVWYL